jgi:pimeloyl-ACP methyl ester carboxylesterase
MAVRRPLTLFGIGAGVVTGLGLVAVKSVALLDRRRSGLSGTKELEAAGSPPEPTDLKHVEVKTPDGAVLHMVEAGPTRTGADVSDAPVVVLLHGVTLSWEIWHKVIRALMTDHRVIAPDWRGHGRSVTGSAGYGLHVLASDLATILEHRDVHSAVVVGHSMGGMGLMRFCEDHSAVLAKRVAGTVFLSTAVANVIDGPGPAAVDAVMQWLVRKPRIARNASNVPPGDLGWAFVRYTFGVKPPAAAVELVRRVTVSMDPTATGLSFASLVDHDGRNAMRTLPVPAVVVVGDHDRLTPPAKAREILDLLPERVGPTPGIAKQFVELAGAGHLTMLEQPENVVRVLRDFVDATRVCSAGHE